jgi:hypothetical protein
MALLIMLCNVSATLSNSAARCFTHRLSDGFPVFQGLSASFTDNQAEWHDMYDSTDPAACDLPEPWGTELDMFQKLILVR